MTYFAGGLPGTVLSIGSAVAFFYGGMRVIDGTLTLGTMGAFLAYLGPDRNAWAAHDATELVTWGGTLPPVLLDQGLADKFLAEQLHLDRFEAACRKTGQALTVRRHATSDHGYYFIQTVVGDHVAHHAAVLCA